MTVIEALGHDKAELSSQFEKWASGPGRYDFDFDGCMSRYDSLLCAYRSENYQKFLDWAFSEYREFSNGDICCDGTVIVNAQLKDKMQVLAVNLFSTGWAYHLNCMKRDGLTDFSKPFASCIKNEFRQAVGLKADAESSKDLISRIDRRLEEHDPGSSRCICYYGLSDAEKKFYFEYDKVLRTVKVAMLNGSYALEMSYIREILGRKSE